APTERPDAPGRSALRSYDDRFYESFAEGVDDLVAAVKRSKPWLGTVRDAFREEIPALSAPPQVIVHGEFFPANVLSRDGVIYPVDWESAAVGAGEIDLAALIELWPEDIATACRDEYIRARWPEGPPRDVDRLIEL